MMPEVGVSAPIKISADALMLSVVFPNRTAVEVMVVKPEVKSQNLEENDGRRIVWEH